MVEVAGARMYLSLPSGQKAPLPALIVIHEWWGLNEHVMHWADRLATDGYAALAVDLFGGQVATTPERAMQLIKAVDAAQATKTLLAAHDFLETDQRVKAPRTGSVGWCFGGKWSLELAIAQPDLDAAVVYYGNVTTDAERLKKIRAKLLAVFGTRDTSIPASQVESFDRALAAAGVERRVLSFDADHAFANPSGARYDGEAAAAAWNEVRPFLARHLKSR
jgi:carboxymethylenebutenolidase